MARFASTRVTAFAMSMMAGGLVLAGCSGAVSTPPAAEPTDTPAVTSATATPAATEPTDTPAVASATATPEPAAGTDAVIPSPTSPQTGSTATDSAAVNDSFRRRSQFVPLDNPEFIQAADASFLSPDDRILGLTFQGESRAYPLRMMTYHHIANDTIGGRPFLVTF